MNLSFLLRWKSVNGLKIGYVYKNSKCSCENCLIFYCGIWLFYVIGSVFSSEECLQIFKKQEQMVDLILE